MSPLNSNTNWTELRESLRVNRLGVLWFFSIEGGSIGVFMAFLPQIQDSLSLNDDALGTAVFCFYLGEMVGTPIVAYLLRKYGAKSCSCWGSMVFSGMLVVVAFANSFFSLCSLFVLLGLAECLLDVSMNALAVLVEIVAGYPICGSFHGTYSLSAAAGGIIGGALVSANFVQLHVTAVLSAISFMVSSFFGIAMYNDNQEKFVETESKNLCEEDLLSTSSSFDINRGQQMKQHDENTFNILRQDGDKLELEREGSEGVSLHTVPSSNTHRLETLSSLENETNNTSEKNNYEYLLELLMLPRSADMMALAALAFLAAFGESALTTWIIFFFQREFEIKCNGSLDALGFALFELFMGLGRYLVDIMRSRVGSNRMVFYGGCLTIIGMVLIVSSPSMGTKLEESLLPFFLACFGSSLVGFGLSTLIPISYISAGYCKGHSGTSIAVVATWAGAGCIASSPIVGALSTALGSLRTSLAVLAVCLAPICCIAHFLPKDRYTHDETTKSSSKASSIVERSQEDLTQPLII